MRAVCRVEASRQRPNRAKQQPSRFHLLQVQTSKQPHQHLRSLKHLLKACQRALKLSLPSRPAECSSSKRELQTAKPCLCPLTCLHIFHDTM